jgi:hypothetical protein
MIFRRITLPPLVPDPMYTPLKFPPILLSSTRFSLLVPIKPTPKLLLTNPGPGLVWGTEPFPEYVFNRTRLWLLLRSHVPPQGNPLEPPAFLTETFPSISLSVTSIN